MTKTRARSVLPLLVVSIAASCGGGGGSGGGPADASGTLGFVPDDTSLPVLEPNDSVDQAQPVPITRASGVERIELRDVVDPEKDALDAFRLRSRERLRVHARLVRVAGGGRAPELLVYDPVAMRPLRVATDGDATFVMRGACDLVVRATDARAEYALFVRTERARSFGASDVELGQVASGDEVELASSTGARTVRFTASEAIALDAAELGGAEARDATSGTRLEAGVDGTIAVPALASVELVVPGSQPARPAGTLRARRAAASTIAGSSRVPAAVTRSRVPALGLEGVAPSAAYGRPRLAAARGELLVLARAGSSEAETRDALAARGLARRDAIPGDVELVAFDATSTTSDDASRVAVALAESLAVDDRFVYAERNLVRRASGVTPNDTHYALQWHYPLLHLPEAWSITTGDDSIIVAVIDTGETTHPDLAGRQIAGYDFISNATNAGDGDGRDADPTDVGDGDGVHPSSFHGTHVAGTIGAATNNGSGVAGVTWFGKIMHLRVLGVDGGTDFDIANAIRYAARLANASNLLPPARANVINMSLGGPGASSTVQSAVTAARAQNVVIFAAAGNEDTSAPSYPAAYTGVISVAAVDFNGNRAPYSNFGASVDVAAPGGDTSVDLDNDGYVDGVLSTLIDDSGPGMPSPVFAFYQGTSMACPHAAGVAALMLAVDPTLTPAEIETILTTTATDLGAPGRDDQYGHGLVHAERAVLAAQGTAPPAMPVLQVAPQSIAFGATQSTISVGVANAGTGALDVTSIQSVTMDGASWLSAIPIASQSASSDTASIQVHVDRTGLADGSYSGTVTVDSNGGMQVVAVTMVVDATMIPVDVDLFVLAVDATTLESVQEVVANPTTTLDYLFTDLPEGSYFIVAGSDDDNDGFICGEGDTYCGLYPTVNEPVSVRVSGSDLGGLDFPVAPQTSALVAPHGPGGAAGFRLRTRSR